MLSSILKCENDVKLCFMRETLQVQGFAGERGDTRARKGPVDGGKSPRSGA
jgi:hypothetical protein